MRKGATAFLCAVALGCAHAQPLQPLQSSSPAQSVQPPLSPASSWFNIQGDPADPGVDTIEVNPTPLSINHELRTMAVRVSRSEIRNNWDGVPYRSYIAEVLFDCTSLTASYVAMEYFMQPAWKGRSHLLARYAPGNTRPMRFLDVTPNPRARIMRAVCQSAGVTSN